jgi:hypothetical protein
MWNLLIRQLEPCVRDLSAMDSVADLVPIFPGVDQLRYWGDNLMLTVRGGQKFEPPERILSVVFVVADSFFSARANVKTSNVSNIIIFDKSIPCSAAEMLNHLKHTSAVGFELVTEPRCWKIVVDKVLLFQFDSISDAVEPSMSRMVKIEYFFGGGRSSVRPNLSLGESLM